MYPLHQFRILISGLLFIFILGSANAGTSTVPSFDITASCDSITASFNEGFAAANIAVNIEIISSPSVGFTPSFYERLFLSGSSVVDTVVFTFDSPLVDVYSFEATIQLRVSGADFPFGESTLFVIDYDCTSGVPPEAEPKPAPEKPFLGCNDSRLNQNHCEPVALYSVESDDGIGLDIWAIDPDTSAGKPNLYLPAETLSTAFQNGTNVFCILATSKDERTGVYLRPDGQLVVVNGPDFENKFFGFTFETFPGIPTLTTYIGNSLPFAPDCFATE